MDDHVDANVETQTLSGKETKRSLTVGDRVRARIVGLTLNEKTPQDSRIALTMRQPGLGKLSWIEEDRNKTSAEAEN
jgi:DNA-directed RNA polymerase subunit E'